MLDVPSWLPELAFSFADGLHRGLAEAVKRDFRRRAETPPAAEEVGGQLHDLLFSGVVGRLWDHSLGALSSRRDGGLRLRLQIALEQAEFLGDVPWELLRNRDTGAYLALDRRTPILRHLEVARPLLQQELPASLKVLGVASEPQDLASLDLAAEKQKLRTGKKRRGWQVAFLEQPTVEQLRQNLVDQGSHVLHFMGHGSFDPESREGALYFEDGQGRGAPFAGSALAAKLAGVPSLRLVVLNACETAVSGSAGSAYGGVAAALVRSGLPAVIAMQRPISDKAAIAFSSAFYHHLATGGDLEAALTEGRQAIHTLSPTGDEWSIPVLFSRAADQGIFAVPDAEAASRRRSILAACAAVLFFLGALSLPGVRELIGGQQVYGLDLEQIIATGVDGLNGRLVSIEILEDGRMRLHFAFENITDESKVLSFDFDHTYLADEHGNAYEVRANSSPISKVGTFTETIPAGNSRTYWVEFQAPQDGARRLHVELATTPRSDARFIPFSVPLPAYPTHLSAPSPPPPRLPESDALPLKIKIDNGRKDVLSEVRQLEVAEQKMRISFDMWNRGSLPLKADFDASGIELRDGRGNVLKPVAMGVLERGRPADLRVDTMLRRGVRTRMFLDFPAPLTRSEQWSLQLATRPDSDFHFVGTAFEVAASIFERAKRSIEEFARKARPKLEARPRVDPPPPAPAREEPAAPPPAVAPALPEARFEIVGAGQEVQSSQEGIRTRILGIERLSNQRLRFVVEIANVAASPLDVPLRLAGTKLSDDLGRQFRLLASSFGEVGEGGPEAARFSVAPGTSREIFFEFSGRVQGSEQFTFMLGSADPEVLRFKPIVTRLPPE